jgi:RNA polymerase sigma-70 factor (ECF subfamily)
MLVRAYRVLGSTEDAEDAVQEALLRVHVAEHAGTQIRDPAPFALKVADHVAIDRRRCARAKREYSVESATLDMVAPSLDPGPAEYAEGVEDLQRALPLLVRSLTPLERAVLLLNEVFGYSYDEIASLVGKTECNCRQIKARARRHLATPVTGRDRSPAEARRLAREFVEAFERGDAEAAIRLVHAQAALVVARHPRRRPLVSTSPR